jgi:DNA polymerase-3 subunit gamma/tau
MARVSPSPASFPGPKDSFPALCRVGAHRYHRPVAQYRALYRTHRPQAFAEVIGQGHVTETLAQEVIGDKVAHAYLFAGPRGTGKTTTARILAKALNCPDRRPDGEPCNVCPSCVAITEGASVDVIELDAASHNKVEDVREIRANVGTVASIGGARRVYILDEAHMLSRAAANALLKTLEEPPEHAHFVLATTEPYKLPDTIRSRTQRFDFHPIGTEVLVDHLARIADVEGMKATHEGLVLIARHAAGSARDALGLMEQVAALGSGVVEPAGVTRALGIAGDEAFARLVKAVADQDAVAGLMLISELATGGTDLRRFASDSLELFRGLFLAHYAPNLEEIVDEPAERLAIWRELIKSLAPGDVLRCIDRLGEALIELREGREERLVVELTVLQMCRPEVARDVSAVSARVDRLEERMRNLRGSVAAAEDRSARAGPQEEPAKEAKPPPAMEAAVDPAGGSQPEEVAESPTEALLDVGPEATAPVDGLELSSVEDAWPVVTTRVRDEAGPRRFALFREVLPTAVDGSTIILEVPHHLPFHLAQMQEDDRLNGILRTVLGEVLGGSVAISYRPGEESAEDDTVVSLPDRAPDKETLTESDEGAIDATKLVVDLLDGEIVD